MAKAHRIGMERQSTLHLDRSHPRGELGAIAAMVESPVIDRLASSMTDLSKPTRRLVGLMIALAAAGCTTIAQQPVPAAPTPQFSALDLRRYGEVGGEPFHVPAVSLEDLQPPGDPRLWCCRPDL